MSFQEKKLSELAIAIPGATKLFREYDLDFCCGGANTLGFAAKVKNLNLAEIEQRLAALEHRQEPNESQNWLQAPYAEIINHIIARFHQRHREQLPELIFLAEKVEKVHGDRPDCPMGVSAVLKEIHADLSQHMQKEEQILFPMINAGQYAMAQMPIQVMEHEHDDAGQQVEVLKSLTDNLTPPHDACNTWRALYTGINEFIDDLMLHIHLENNILFPRMLSQA
ncbi:iron-sulfur cluster repair protein YtfE [Testudinibacter sp. TR-2022]|uniref:iron-sulfur cluster repair protein YtfE n=1 Tax=Testudinibacter sp. TR-2022 TaxID=2585029 RepID=UPI00111934B4|nr:iron-sulfur cluster repair protein YtfE [Testudinibacter sp. TR-2022]TNH09178.1 iron-sulfur cluster repair protein YtfE [Pasteurellaceae bacterium Phil11]TNH23558.1 iron-sulfur cluster repair protein YtfE [Testudinibacter sp. TR-2022]TNH23737.1 iron-sulfur cluster repair protein YtfE [Testudinibacter sp. TR-2022]